MEDQFHYYGMLRLLPSSELKSAKADRDAMKKQAESLAAEYDRVSSELQSLQVSDCYTDKREISYPLFSLPQQKDDEGSKKDQ